MSISLLRLQAEQCARFYMQCISTITTLDIQRAGPFSTFTAAQGPDFQKILSQTYDKFWLR